MSRNVSLLIVIIVIAAVVVGYYLTRQPEPEQTAEAPATEETATEEAATEEAATEEAATEEAATEEAATEEAATEEAAAVDPVASFVAAADAAAGQAIVEAQCAACHSFEDGGDTRVGPNLYGIIGDAQAAREFAYSDALSGLGGTWSYEAMDGFLENPMNYASGTKMGFGGLASQEDRANVIAYLRSNDSEPEPLPEP